MHIRQDGSQSLINQRSPASTTTVQSHWHQLLQSVLSDWSNNTFASFHFPNILDPFQFAWRSHRATEDAIALVIHTALTHFEKGNVLECSSLITAQHLIPSSHQKPITKPDDLELQASICRWIFRFLTDRLRVVYSDPCCTPWSHKTVLLSTAPMSSLSANC